MNNKLTFFLGILTGIIMAAAAVFVIYKVSNDDDITLFDTRGKVMESRSYRIIQTIDDRHGLAIGNGIEFFNPVLVRGPKNAHFYDGLEISHGDNTRFYHVGTYKYKTKEEVWKTVPVVSLMKVK